MSMLARLLARQTAQPLLLLQAALQASCSSGCSTGGLTPLGTWAAAAGGRALTSPYSTIPNASASNANSWQQKPQAQQQPPQRQRRQSRSGAAAATAAAAAADTLPRATEPYYRNPPLGVTSDEVVRTLRPGDRRALARLENAIESALLGEPRLRSALVETHGFTVHRVRLSADRRRVALLWDALPGRAAACARALEANAVRLRQAVSRNSGMKHTPWLDFRHDHLPARAASAAGALARAAVEFGEEVGGEEVGEDAAVVAGQQQVQQQQQGQSDREVDFELVETAAEELQARLAARGQRTFRRGSSGRGRGGGNGDDAAPAAVEVEGQPGVH